MVLRGVGQGTIGARHRHGITRLVLSATTISSTTSTAVAYGILLEDGGSLLQEDLTHLILEFNSYLLLEDGFFLLQEDGTSKLTEEG